VYAASRPGPGGSSTPHRARDAAGSAGWVSPVTSASSTSTGSGWAVSTAVMSAATATANRAVSTSSGRVGPIRSISRPWATEPSETPTSAPAVTSPAAANEPLTRCT
jgi:hypothetical protein